MLSRSGDGNSSGSLSLNGQLTGPLARLLVAGTAPGVILGANHPGLRHSWTPGFSARGCGGFAPARRLALLSGPAVRHARSAGPVQAGNPRLSLATGTIWGIYGIGGGSILGPILAGRGTPMAQTAPAALASTFLASIVGAATYGVLALTTAGDIAPHRVLGLPCGAGGLLGGYLGARFQPYVPEKALRLLLGTLATALAVLYLVQGSSPGGIGE